MNSFERSFMEEIVKIAAEQEAPAENSSKLKNLMKLLAAGGLGYGAYRMYQGHKDNQARQAALMQAMANQSANRKKMLLGGALGAGALGAAHHFGLDASIMEKLKNSAMLEKMKGLFGSKTPSTEVFDQYGGEVSPHEGAQPTGVIESIKSLFGKGSEPKQLLIGPIDKLFPEKENFLPKERFHGIR